jgi:hypothetical protein
MDFSLTFRFSRDEDKRMNKEEAGSAEETNWNAVKME